jgi:hypothetical protein
MKILRRNLFRLWMVGSGLWVVLFIIAHRGVLTNEDIFVAVLPPIILLFVGLGLARTWELFGVTQWLSVPAHIRRGLQRVYLVLAVPWVAWYGYQIASYAGRAHYSSSAAEHLTSSIWLLLLVPLGGPILLRVIIWIVQGFASAGNLKQVSTPLHVPTSTLQEELEKLRKRMTEDICCRPDLAVDQFLRTGMLSGRKLEEGHVLDEAKLSGEQKAALPSAYYGEHGIEPGQLAPYFGYTSGDAMIDRLIELERKVQASGGREKLIDALIDAELVKILTGQKRAKPSSPIQ